MSGEVMAKRISPMLAVGDMDETIRFYENVLGFQNGEDFAGVLHCGT